MNNMEHFETGDIVELWYFGKPYESEVYLYEGYLRVCFPDNTVRILDNDTVKQYAIKLKYSSNT